MRTYLQFHELHPTILEPIHHSLILFFMMINEYFESIQIAIEAKEHFLWVEERHGLLHMLVSGPVTLLEVLIKLLILLHRLHVLVGSVVVLVPIGQHGFLRLLQRTFD